MKLPIRNLLMAGAMAALVSRSPRRRFLPPSRQRWPIRPVRYLFRKPKA